MFFKKRCKFSFVPFFFFRWNFRIPEASLHLHTIPLMKSAWEITMPPIYSVVSLISSSFLALAQPSLRINQRLKHLTLYFLTKQEMDAADFKGLVSDQWHVGMVGTQVTSRNNCSCTTANAYRSDALRFCRGLVQAVLHNPYRCWFRTLAQRRLVLPVEPQSFSWTGTTWYSSKTSLLKIPSTNWHVTKLTQNS